MSCLDLSTNAGVKLYIGDQTDLPADMDQATWDAVTSWVQVSEIASIGARGVKRNIIEYKSLEGVICKAKGSTNYGTMTFNAADVPSDAGQVLMTEAVASNLNYPFKIEHDDTPAGVGSTPTIEYFPGMVGSWGMAQAGDSDSIREREAEVALNNYLYVPAVAV